MTVALFFVTACVDPPEAEVEPPDDPVDFG